MRSPEDRLYARWCRRGDARALAALFDRVAPRLLRLGVHLVGDAGEAEDLVQATFLALIEQRARLDPDRAAVPWLTAVLGHKARDARRRAARPVDARRLVERVPEDASAAAERRELSGELARALDRLEEPYRQPALLRLKHGLAPADIAHLLGRDPGTVRVQLHRARELLRAMLPASLAGAVALGVTPTRGLAAVRSAVMSEAAGAAVPATTLLLTGAWIVKPKIALALGGLAAVIALTFTLRPTPEVELPEPLEEGVPGALAGPRGEADVLERTGERAPRVAASPAAGPARHLRGVVVDADTDRPVLGATVRLFDPRRVDLLDAAREHPDLYASDGSSRTYARVDWPHVAERSVLARFGGEEVLVYDRIPEEATPRASAVTDGEGRFALRADAGGGLLVAEHAGYAGRLRAAHDTGVECRIALRRSRTISGRVVQQDGAPPGVPLELGLAASVPGSWRNGDGVEMIGVWRAQCAADGSFAAEIGADHVSVTVLTPGWIPRTGAHLVADRPVTLVVRRVPVLRFLDAVTGAPIERVRLLGRERTNGYVRWSGLHDAPGGVLEVPEYLLEYGYPLGITAWAEGYAATRLPLVDLEEVGVQDVLLHPGEVAKLSGAVRRSGGPAVGAVVALVGHGGPQWREDEDHIVDGGCVDPDGSFGLSAPAGEYVLRVEHEGTRYFELVELPRSEEILVNLDATGRLDVRITDEAGSPRAEHVVVLRADDDRSFIRHTDEEGCVVFADLSSQGYTVGTPFVTTRGSFRSDVLHQRVELARGERREIRLEVPAPPGPFHLRVRCRGVASYAGWRARFGRDPWEPLAPDGALAQELPDARHHTFEVEAPGGRSWHLDIPRDAREGDVVDLDPGDGAYEGRLLDAEGRPLAGWKVHAVALEREGGQRVVAGCTTDGGGRFELTGLHPGTHRLDCRRGTYDFTNGEHVFLPDAPAASSTPLILHVPTDVETATLEGVVLAAEDRSPLADHFVRCVGLQVSEGGEFRLTPDMIRTDVEGRFTLRVPRVSRYRVLVYSEWTKEGLVLDREVEVGASMTLELLVDG